MLDFPLADPRGMPYSMLALAGGGFHSKAYKVSVCEIINQRPVHTVWSGSKNPKMLSTYFMDNPFCRVMRRRWRRRRGNFGEKWNDPEIGS